MQIDFIEQSAGGSGFVYKTTQGLFVFDGTTFKQIGTDATFTATTGSGTSVMNISAVLSGTVGIGQAISGGTLTPTTITSFGTFNGVSGTVNLGTVQTWTNPTTVTAISSFPKKTVRGIVYLDGAYYVMTPEGLIYGSKIKDPSAWTALNVISSESEPDTAVCLARQLNLIVAFGAYSTEFFYNANNPPPGSVLLPYTSAFLEIGCASAESVVNAENSIYFMSVGRQKGRSIAILEGTVPKVISTAYVDRILNGDSLKGVTAYFIKLQGHGFYVISLPNSNVTLVYDSVTNKWCKWTTLERYFPSDILVTNATWANGEVTLTVPLHNCVDGSYTEILNVLPIGYNGQYVVNVIDQNTITYKKTTNPGVYIESGDVHTYTEKLFLMSSYTKTPSFDLVQDSTTGVIFAVSTEVFQDNGNPIKFVARTENIDGGTNHLKFYSRMELIGDKVEATAYVRFSDDDYRTWNKYRPVDLSNKRSQLYRCGSSRRRAYDVINYNNKPIRLNNIELSVEKGYT